MAAWTFAQGRGAERASADVAPAGATRIELTPGGDALTVGAPLFISESEGAEAEFLGAVVEMAGDEAAFTLPLRRSKNAGARLWHPQTSLSLAADGVLPLRRRERSGIAIERSLGGEHFAVRVAAASDEMQLSLEGLTPAGEAAVIAWLDAAAGGGLHPFTLIRPDGRIEVVRLADESRTRVVHPGHRVVMHLPLRIEAAGRYR